MLPKRLRKSNPNRRAAATIEFAVCLPIIVLIVLGSIEAANMMFLKQSLIQASYEGAKVAIIRESTSGDTRTAVESVLEGRSIRNVNIEFTPANIEDAVPGELINVTVSAPGGANSFLNVNPFRDMNVSVTASMVKE